MLLKGHCRPLTLFKGVAMDLSSSDCGSGSFNSKPNTHVPSSARSRNTQKKPPSRDGQRKTSSAKEGSNSDYSMTSFSTEAPKSGNSEDSDSRHKRKRGNVTVDEDSLSSESVESSNGASDNRNPVEAADPFKKRRIDVPSRLQSQLDAQQVLQGKIAQSELSSSRAIASRFLGGTGTAFSSLSASPMTANLYVPSPQHFQLERASQLSELLRNCGLGAAVATLANPGPLFSFDGSPLAPSFLGHHQRQLYSYQNAMGGISSGGGADYLNAFAARASLVPPPQQQQQPQPGMLDASLTATWLRLLDASGGGYGSASTYSDMLAAHNHLGGAAAGLRPADRLESLPSNIFSPVTNGVRRDGREREQAAQQSSLRQSRAEEGKSVAGRSTNSDEKKRPAAPPQVAPPPLPPCDEGDVLHYSERIYLPLATDEDQNWLSEFLCFVRGELVEVFRASREDVASRLNSKKVSYGQVGIRCRYCAHLPHNVRASRSSSFPSSVGRIYQSLTMMLREHFGNCKVIPQELRDRFLELKSKTSQGATNSKRYWIHSAMKLGMVDSSNGIWVTEKSQAIAKAAPPFGMPQENAMPAHSTSSVRAAEIMESPVVLMVSPSDRELVSEFLYTLMTQVQRVYLTESERVGSRKNLPLGLPGIGCRHCCPSNRRGLCRFFPARRRTLPNKLTDLYSHIRRCTLCPNEIKDQLAALELTAEQSPKDTDGERAFFDHVWTRLGH